MRRKEKLYVMISFVVGTCLFFISLAMIFCNIRKIEAEEKQQVEIFAQEKGDHANSWRYEDGKAEGKYKKIFKNIDKASDKTFQCNGAGN